MLAVARIRALARFNEQQVSNRASCATNFVTQPASACLFGENSQRRPFSHYDQGLSISAVALGLRLTVSLS
jgi:hypothetical protein